ncbi:hypothetical protein BGX27_009146 [Mortierella sp. AM989]|nr:hypothetical protein BGX27_009146 [Mortierella sp. AM989]
MDHTSQSMPHPQRNVTSDTSINTNANDHIPPHDSTQRHQTPDSALEPLNITLKHTAATHSNSSHSLPSSHGNQPSHGSTTGHSHHQSQSHASHATPTPLFQLVNFPSRLVLDNVYLNNLHSLRRFGIKNTSHSNILVKMRSSLGAQISFQLTNENLPFDPDMNGSSLQTISTNTAAAAEAESLTATGHQFNQLFNHVNLIDEVTIAAGETEYVILGFLPDARGRNRRGKWDSNSAGLDITNANSGNGSAHGDSAQVHDDSRQRDLSANGLASGSNINSEEFEDNDQQTDSFDSFEVNGLVFFFAYKINSTNADRVNEASPNATTDASLASSPPLIHDFPLEFTSAAALTNATSNTQGSSNITSLSHESSSTSVSLAPVTAAPKADYQHSVKFRSTVCRSVLYSNIGETGINFEDCIANQEFVKDFTIWNRSEIPLYWQLNVVDVGNTSRESWLKFVDYEDSFGGNAIEEGVNHSGDQSQPHHPTIKRAKPIPSYGYRRIRVIFRPVENGDFLFDLILENLNDASNIEEASIHATVRAVSRGEDTLAISTGNTLDFGDCCAGMWTRLPVTFSNTGLTPTEIHLKVEGAEVVFDIQTEAGAGLTEVTTDHAKDSKFMLDSDITSNWYDSSRRSESSANTDSLEHSPSAANLGRSRLRDWMEDGLHSPNTPGFMSSSASVSDSTGAKGVHMTVDSGPSSPVTSEGFFPENIQQINSNVEKYLANQDLSRPSREGTEDDLESEPDGSSVQDSTNVSSLINHKKRLSLRSISFSGAQRDRGLAQSQLHGPKSPVRGSQSTTRIEELFLKPGKDRTVIVSYRPARDSSIENFQAGKLLRKSFRITVSYAPWVGNASSVPFSENPQKDRKIIQCKARACTSFVTVEPKSLDFGDTDVGALKSMPIKLINQSEIPAIVQLDFQSKVLNCTPSGPITIPPKSGTELKLDIYPRKVNPDYRKQLTLFNLTNRANDQIIEVRSTNIDKNRVTFHSLFYRVLYPGGTNFLDFGNVVVGGISLRTLTISNFTRKWLTLKVTTSLTDELTVYERARDRQVHLNEEMISALLANGQNVQGDIRSGISSENLSMIASRGVSPSFAESEKGHISAIDGSKSALLKRRQDTRDQHSATGSESGAPGVIGGSTIASSLALKAKAILFHNDLSQTMGSSPAKFLDLATSKPKEVKKITRRVPTMKELLEPTSRSNISSVDRSGKGVAGNSMDSTRTQRPHQSNSTNAIDGGAKRPDATSATQRQHDRKTSQNDSNDQLPTDTSTDHPFLNERSLDSVLAALDANSAAGGTMLFYKPSEEESFVKERMRLTRELYSAISSGELAPASIVSVPPETEYQLIILFSPLSTIREHIKGIPKKQDARIFLRLLDFDQETVANNPQFRPLLDGDLTQIPLREIMVRSSLVRSIMDLGQNNINFGTMDKGEKRTKTIVIQNRSKEPLLYHIRKSGSIASGDIILGNGKSGVIRGYSKKEVDFIFEPSLSGPYQENLAIENIQDPESSRFLSIKANIRKPKHFSIDSQEVDFGICYVGKKTSSKRITVTNSTKQTRTFEVRVDPHEMMPLSTESHHYGGEIEFTLEDDPAGQAVVTKEMEDEIEILEQKLKIAKRKGREDKVLKVTARLSLLRKGGVEDKVDSPQPTPDASEATPTQEKVMDLTKGDQTSPPTVDTTTKSVVVSTPTSATPVTTPMTKDILKFRRTDHSIIFTLEGGKTKSVSAYFTALRDQLPTSYGVTEKDRLRLQGKIYVHEHKNRDICRDVMFYATVECKSLPNGDVVDAETEQDVASFKKTSKTISKKSALGVKGPEDSPLMKKIAFETVAAKVAPIEPEPPVEHLVLSPKTFDGGRIEHGLKCNFYFTLSNSSDKPLPFRIDVGMDSSKSSHFVFDESELHGSLAPKETRRITFGYSADDLGRLRDSLRVVNMITLTPVEYTFTCYSHRAQYLAFPSVDESMTLDLGHCYVDTGRKYSQVTPLLVENITDDDIYITCASNLSQQVGIYLDEQAERGQVTKTLLKKHSMITVWVAVQPNLLGGIAGGNTNRRTGTSTNGHGSANKDRDSECRTLIGGIKFTISLPEERPVIEGTTSEESEEIMTQVFTQTVKFTSIIGRSILSVSDTLLNLGWTPDVGRPVYGSFTLQNMSSLLPLHFRVESLSGNIILDRTGGILDGWDADKATTALHSRSASNSTQDVDGQGYGDNDPMEAAPTDRSRLLISFRVTASTSGLLTDTILVTNENNCSQKIEIKVGLFVDPRQLLMSSRGDGYVCPITLEDLIEIQDVKPGVPREGLVLPRLTWKDVHVNLHEEQCGDDDRRQPFVSFQPPYGDDVARIEERWVEFINESDEVMELVPLTDIEATAFWGHLTPDLVEQDLSSTETKEIDGFHFCGSVARLAPKQKIRLLVSCPAPNIPANEHESLQNGKNVSLTGDLMVMNRLKNQVVKVLGLTATFGISYCEVVPLSIDLGKIGHYNSWEQVKFEFEVKNSSDIPFQFEIVLENYMELWQPVIESDSPDAHLGTHMLGTKRTIQERGIHRVDVVLDPRRIENFSAGRRTLPIKIVNLNNPRNEITLDVNAILTEFELGFDRLTDGTLVLPQLMHPLPLTALPCDAWFSIINKTQNDVRFEIGATLSPDVSDYVHLDVLSRFSNSPLRGTISLSSRGSIEVRVRAFPKDGSRLPSDTSALCIPEGLTFGSLWVSTKSSNSEEDSTSRRFAEVIPIRGTLVEGVIFSLSTQRIVFRSLLEASDYEGDSDDENLSVPDSSNQASSRDISDDGSSSDNQQASIIISNLSVTFPLDFQVTLEGPMEYPAAEIIKISPLDSNNCGSVEAGQQLKLTVEFIDPHVIISEDIKVFIRNLNSNLGQQQRVIISIVSDNREHRKPSKKHVIEDERIDPHHHQNKLEEPDVIGTNGNSIMAHASAFVDVDSSILQPVISLRGCKRIDSGDSAGGRYELDLGQQDMGSSNVLRKLVLENATYDRVSYRIKTITALDKNWLKISRLEGTLEPPADEQSSGSSTSVQTITLSFTTNVRNVFSTYLLIENLDNPADTKTVRITMEVVARQNLRRATKGNEANNRVFDVFVNGIDHKNSTSIEMKNLYYGSEYTARSMVVYNRETVPMEFTFKSNLSPADTTEVLFSTSRTSAKLFKTLTVPSENHVRIYIRFFPRPSAAIQAALDNGEYRDPDEMELKTVEIYINCRLVKDYQQVVVLTAECYLPAIRTSWLDSVSFVARISRESSESSEGTDEWKVSFQEDYRILGVSNLLDIPLEYEIVNDTMYFNLEYPETDKVIDGLMKHEIRVVPNVKALLRNPENFRREKYVQENITIYNRNRPLENYWIPLRISFGNVTNFQLSSGYKSSYAFGMIEQHVVKFLSDFNTNAVLVTKGSSNGCFSNTSSSPTPGSGPGSIVGMGSGFNLDSVGFGPERGPISFPNSGSPTSPNLLLSGAMGGLNVGTLLSPPTTGPAAGMLGLGRAMSGLSAYHAPSHHPHYQSPEAQETQRKLIDLEFQYRYVVDQLVYYSTIKTGENFFQLASLLFCTLLGNRIFQIWSPAYLKDPRKSANSNLNTTAAASSAASTSALALGLGGSSAPSVANSGAGSNSGGGVAASGSGPTVEYDENGDRALVQAGANGFTIQNHQRYQDESQIRIWPESLRKWVEALDYFVSFFPFHARQLETLKALHHSLISS